MSDKPDSLDALATVRKRCPQCGHENHMMAKVCVNCGYEFPLTLPTQDDGTEKICPKCGHANRPGAKICSQCGTALPADVLPPAPTPVVGAVVTRAKKCPDCGMVCKLDAKVCPNCGHRFQTDFSQAGKAQPGTPPAITEPPVVQMPSVGIALPSQFDARSHWPDLPPDPTPPLPVPTPALPDTPANATPDAAADAGGDTSGEPAPDLTDLDIDALRRRSPDHSDFSGRVNISFRKDRP
ncbi:MAG: zinc ribbon domain-containing protein [Aggregatilineales bacterium]